MVGVGGKGGGCGKKREIGCFSNCCEQPNDLDKEGRNYWQQAKHALDYILTYRFSRKKKKCQLRFLNRRTEISVSAVPHCGQ